MNLKETCRRHIFYICHANQIKKTRGVQWYSHTKYRKIRNDAHEMKGERKMTMTMSTTNNNKKSLKNVF